MLNNNLPHTLARIIPSVFLLGAAITVSQAVVIVNINNVGSDLVATVNGSLNTTGLDTYGVYEANDPAQFDFRSVISRGNFGPSNFGDRLLSTPNTSGITQFHNKDGLTYASSDSGDHFGIALYDNKVIVYLPGAYTSGSPLSSSATWGGQSVTSLGLIPGTYNFSWGSGATADSITMNISSVPEPHEYSMMAGCGLIGLALWHQHKKRRTVQA